ncbi:hypothetical protein SAMN05216198_3550 [Halopseudomonas litoralis]|uniref:Uncharacterized protein n=1 Tax=Halopseudomonas litoralis TaxID=797277 RepID=A0A1H1XAJ0_9GAMM|nr:hypothetical protein [Halopseudomonas litoralis]SDT06090.1 hypothetical protein SAMN05216198_3550 [Halopseudomonas litoralis]
MEGFWIGAVKYCGITAVAGLVGYTIYPQIIASPYLKNLTHTELFALLVLIVIMVFGLCLALVNAGSKRSPGNNYPQGTCKQAEKCVIRLFTNRYLAI